MVSVTGCWQHDEYDSSRMINNTSSQTCKSRFPETIHLYTSQSNRLITSVAPNYEYWTNPVWIEYSPSTIYNRGVFSFSSHRPDIFIYHLNQFQISNSNQFQSLYSAKYTSSLSSIMQIKALLIASMVSAAAAAPITTSTGAVLNNSTQCSRRWGSCSCPRQCCSQHCVWHLRPRQRTPCSCPW